jgi:signal transduction histidine kinase
MVTNLLMLGRLDAHQITFRREPIRLAELVNSCWQPFSGRALKRSIVYQNRIPDAMTCQSDPDNLPLVLSNLFDNAVEYTNEGGRIWTAARRVNDSVEICIANTGCTLTSEQAVKLFDCFWRADSSRPDTGVHCGLGLALVQRTITALRGSASAEVHDRIFTVRLTLPHPPDTEIHKADSNPKSPHTLG